MRRIARRAACAMAFLPCLTQAASSPVVETFQGLVQGTTVGNISTWLGIPYAAPPVNALRWRSPQPPEAHSGLLQAAHFGASCPQTSDVLPTSENCLFLNVYSPSGAGWTSGLPVMVWIHGGALVSGEGADYDGSTMAAEANVVVVTINYRLGLLGFMAHPALTAESSTGSSGNYGLQDQQAAVHWVKENIAGFGGDPRRVTIFGESAGGLSVQSQLTSPGLPQIHSAIIESGSYSTYLPSLGIKETEGTSVAQALHCGAGSNAAAAACLRARSANELVTEALQSGVSISPNVDGTTLPLQPLQAFSEGQFQHIPIIIGNNHDEYRLFVSLDDLRGHPTTQASYSIEIKALFRSYAPQLLAAYPSTDYIGSAYACGVNGDPSACGPGYAFASMITDYSFACTAHLVAGMMAQYAPVYSYEFNEPNTPTALQYDRYMPNLGDYHTSELPYVWPNLSPANSPLSTEQQALGKTMRAYWSGLASTGAPSAPAASVWPLYAAQNVVQSLVSTGPVGEQDFSTNHQCELWAPILPNNFPQFPFKR